MLTGGVRPGASATARASFTSAAAGEHRRKLRQISAGVALVSTLRGLNTALPTSFSQACARISPTTRARSQRRIGGEGAEERVLRRSLHGSNDTILGSRSLGGRS